MTRTLFTLANLATITACGAVAMAVGIHMAITNSRPWYIGDAQIGMLLDGHGLAGVAVAIAGGVCLEVVVCLAGGRRRRREVTTP